MEATPNADDDAGRPAGGKKRPPAAARPVACGARRHDFAHLGHSQGELGNIVVGRATDSPKTTPNGTLEARMCVFVARGTTPVAFGADTNRDQPRPRR